MPIALDPKRTFTVTLESDRDKPVETRPLFVCRYLTARQWKEIARLQDGIDESAGGAEALERIIEAIAMGLVGWENMIAPDGERVPFDAHDLDTLLTMPEAMELFQKMLAQQQLTGADAKKSESRSPTSTVESAKPADATPTEAATIPRP